MCFIQKIHTAPEKKIIWPINLRYWLGDHLNLILFNEEKYFLKKLLWSSLSSCNRTSWMAGSFTSKVIEIRKYLLTIVFQLKVRLKVRFLSYLQYEIKLIKHKDILHTYLLPIFTEGANNSGAHDHLVRSRAGWYGKKNILSRFSKVFLR